MANKHCRKFEEHDDYINAINNNELSIHTVSYCKDEKDLHYDSDLFLVECVFNVTDISQPTTILNGVTSVSKYIIDDVLLSVSHRTFQFQRTGLHYVKYSLKTMPILGAKYTTYYSSDDIFRYCQSLISFKVNKDIKELYYYSFNETGLLSVNIPKTITNIKIDFNLGGPFNDCWDLTTITVDPDNPTYDSRNNCNGVIETATNKLIIGCKTTVIPDGITTIGVRAFSFSGRIAELYNVRIPSITIPSSVTKLERFGLVLPVESLHIPATLTDIYPPYNTLQNVSTLELPFSNKFLENLTVDENHPFFDSRDNCNALIHTASNTLIMGGKNTVIPNTVTIISVNAFRNPEITSITIPSSITNIATNMGLTPFDGCTGLETVIFLGETPPTIGSATIFTVAKNPNLTNIYVPDESVETYKTLFTTKAPDVVNYVKGISTMP